MTREAHAQTMMTARQSAGVELELKFVSDRKTFKAALSLPLLGGAAAPRSGGGSKASTSTPRTPT